MCPHSGSSARERQFSSVPEAAMLLPDYPFQISYGASDDRLNGFYLPALSRSVRFDRSTGFFSSHVLAMAAAGIVRLIVNGGRMRLLCGAELAPEDVRAVAEGAAVGEVVNERLRGCLDNPADRSQRARLEALAWMVANGTLDIRVVLPKSPDGLPLPAEEAREYFHIKEGVFEDAAGNRLAFSGSSNDSENGWLWNYEAFQVYTTWERRFGADVQPPEPLRVGDVTLRFDRLWEAREPDWIAIPVPEAAREGLLRYCPDRPPTRDPLEGGGKEPPAGGDQGERVLFHFLRLAPRLPGGDRLAARTANLVPWPHQQRTAAEVVARYPESFLFCDEVGLGKTIEVGLALRELIVTGRVRRALLLVPASVLRQWQEELWEKFALNVPRYQAGEVRDRFNREVPTGQEGPWKSHDLLLAGSQLAKRRQRQAEVLAGGPWDLVVVDEAHHARRKDIRSGEYRPNRLLELLLGRDGEPGLRDLARCLYLLTATPMQVHPVEVWDLLRVVGIAGRWGAREAEFLRYYDELARPYEERDWDFLLAMWGDHMLTDGTIEETVEKTVKEQVGEVTYQKLRELPFLPTGRRTAALQLGPDERAALDLLLQRVTPVRRRMWRNTRALLRRYREKGLLRQNVPTRRPQNIWVPLRKGAGGERELYERIDEYIADYYQKYEGEKKGLGFVMAVYRRRLTSSFYALQRSLERRLEFLEGKAGLRDLLTDEDLEEDELERDVDDLLAEQEDPLRQLALSEMAYVQDFVRDLSELSSDSKFGRLVSDLSELFRRRDKVIVFTQYVDTMDYLREHLCQVYGRQVACYSGQRGGERWDGVRWLPCTKEELKAAFREGDDIRLLLCTDSASEGLNLQTCGVLINYDMPWNPMRVEQRIGRIDRIGQRYPDVWIHNYFYEDTVEAEIYRRLETRIRWFEDVVGRLQPILHEVGNAIEELALLPRDRRERELERRIAEIERRIDQQEAASFDLDEVATPDEAPLDASVPPVSLEDLEAVLTRSAALKEAFQRVARRSGVYRLKWQGSERLVTFDPDVFDSHPDSVELLTYGNPTLHALLDAVEPPQLNDQGAGVAFAETGLAAGAFRLENGRPNEIESLAELEESLGAEHEAGGGWTQDTLSSVRQRVVERAREQSRREANTERLALEAEKRALVEKATDVLVKTALIDARLKLLKAGGGGDESLTGALAYGEAPVKALGDEGVPFRGLLAIVGSIPRAEPTDPYAVELEHLSEHQLLGRRNGLKQEGRRLLARYSEIRGQLEAAEARDDAATATVAVAPWSERE